MKCFTITLACLVGSIASAAEPSADLKLWYAQPAPLEAGWTYPAKPDQQTKGWLEALPVGSGRLGAMVFGGVPEERIQFNEDTLWTGKPHDYVRKGARQHLDEIRKGSFANLADGSDEEKALNKLVKEKFLSDPVRQKAYQPFGDIRLTIRGHEEFTDYRRELDLDSAVARVAYRAGDVTYTREVLASYPDNVIAVRLSADKPGKVAFTVKLDSWHKNHVSRSAGKDVLALTGQVLDPVAKNEPGLKFESRLRVLNTGGTLSASGDAITVRDADAATLLLVAATSFVNWQDASGDPARCAADLQKVEGKTYEALKLAHVADHQKLFRRVTLDLGRTDRADLPTDERLRRVNEASKSIAGGQKDKPKSQALPAEGLDADPALATLFFQYGRYLLIASSRPGTQPANLQGVWNELLNPPWESKYTTNINAEMNYWPAEVTNLSETHEPLFDMIDDLRVSGARTAKSLYGCDGWVLHHNTDLWRGTAPINNVDGLWPTGAAWLCHHLWDHYLYTGDKAFLAKRAYPAMKEASQFFLDFLVEDPKTGYLVTVPSHSPEIHAEKHALLTYGPTMDNQLMRSLFTYTIEAAQILGNVDGDFVKKIEATCKRLPPNQVGRHGQLQEWIEDWDKVEDNHRHMSPLWGLYPGWDITPSDGKVYDAAKLLLKWRGDGSTGWSFSWRIPLWARVHDGNFAYRQLHLQLAKRTLPNMFDLCGPFQIDGNFGAPAGMAEMLLQSHLTSTSSVEARPTEDRAVHQIDLLPALPRAWPRGSVTGLCARGGFDVDMTWADGKLTKATVHSKLGNPCRLRVGENTVDLKTEKGTAYTFDGSLKASTDK
jgi:alpha-L-fucosidase 2